MRLSLLVLFLTLPSLILAANPTPGQEDPFCLLSSISFTGGITFKPEQPFDGKVFDYTVNCPNLPLKSTVTPLTSDPESSSEIFFNGANVNTKAGHNAVSNTGNVDNSPNKHSDELTFQQGSNTIQVGVSCNGMGTPPCYYIYSFTCTCNPQTPGGRVVGDPQFTGLRGQSYQIHGVSGEVYNIVSDPKFQLNARFVFLDHGKCPIVDGKKAKGCWAHPGSYLGAIGLKTVSGDRIELISGAHDQGFQAVNVNGKPLNQGDSILFQDNLGAISFNNSHTVQINIAEWTFVYENSDMYVNQRVSVLSPGSLKSHGLLGQTHRDKMYPNTIKYIQGSVDDYVIREKDLFGDSFVFNMFN